MVLAWPDKLSNNAQSNYNLMTLSMKKESNLTFVLPMDEENNLPVSLYQAGMIFTKELSNCQKYWCKSSRVIVDRVK